MNEKPFKDGGTCYGTWYPGSSAKWRVIFHLGYLRRESITMLTPGGERWTLSSSDHEMRGYVDGGLWNGRRYPQKLFTNSVLIARSLFPSLCQPDRKKNSANLRGTMIKVVILIGGPMKGKTLVCVCLHDLSEFLVSSQLNVAFPHCRNKVPSSFFGIA